MRIRLRRICSFLIFVFLPAQLVIIIGVHYLHHRDEKLPRAGGKPTEVRASADGAPLTEHEALEVITELQRKSDRKDSPHAEESENVKKKPETKQNEGNNEKMRKHERKLTHILRDGGKNKDNHTAHLPPLIQSQTPILINQTKAAIDQLKKSRDRLFSDAIGPLSDSKCMVPSMDTPAHTCKDHPMQWKCRMVPTFTTYDPVNRIITVNCRGMFRVNQVERLESEYPVSPDNYRQPPFWEYYEGSHNITMETEYADVACKDKLFQDVHNYHTQFLPKPGIDWLQGSALRTIRLKEPSWKPVSILTVVLDSTSRAHFHRRCGLPKTAALLRKYYDGMSSGLSHQSFMFNRLNGISSSTALNLTPLFSGQLYDDVDEDKIRQRIYAKHINEWIWQYAETRGYLTSYGIDNGSGMMGTRTHCKACLYRPPVLPHIEHGWKQRENERVSPTALAGLCEGNHMLHEYILNYTRDFLRHPHPAKWAALDLNAGHRREMESVNQVDNELAKVLQTLMEEDKNLVVFVLGDHGKPFQKDPSYIGSHYETLLPFLSVTMPTWMLHQRPDVFHNLAINQQRYIVHADLHLSMKSLFHFPNIEEVKGARGMKAVNIFQEEIKSDRGCRDADMPMWSCVCGVMKKLPGKEFNDRHREMAEVGLAHINNLHSQNQLSKVDHRTPLRRTSCLDLTFKRLLHVFINEDVNKPINSTQRRIYHMTFQTIEVDTIWDLVIDDQLSIQQVKQVSLYQRFEVCWDKRVPLSYCVCDMSKKAEDIT